MICDKFNPMRLVNLKFEIVGRTDNDTFYQYTVKASDGTVFLSSIDKRRIYDFRHIRLSFERDYKLYLISYPEYLLGVGDIV